MGNKHILVIRFSALGDTAMLLPILYGAALRQPDLHFTLLTSERNAELAIDAPSNVAVWGVKLRHYSGLAGLLRLYREARQRGIDAVADMHGVVRSHVLRWLFRLSGTPVACIRKGRFEKKRLCSQSRCKRLHPLPHTTERYTQVFRQLGISVAPWQPQPQADKAGIGIAPFAKHPGKIYPIHQMEQVVAALAAAGETLYLYGAGPDEEAVLSRWAATYPHVVFRPGSGLQTDLRTIAHLRLMVSMDSANMHLASLVGTRVISIWGATHPFAGFLGCGQAIEDCIQLPLPCRPCSVFGNRRCHRGDYPCLQQISPSTIVKKILS